MTGNPLQAWAPRHQRPNLAGGFSSLRRRRSLAAAAGAGGGHLWMGPLGAGDAAAIGKQDAGVVERHDALAEQAPSLFGMGGHDAGRLAIWYARGRAGRLMLTHDAPIVVSAFTPCACTACATAAAPGELAGVAVMAPFRRHRPAPTRPRRRRRPANSTHSNSSRRDRPTPTSPASSYSASTPCTRTWPPSPQAQPLLPRRGRGLGRAHRARL